MGDYVQIVLTVSVVTLTTLFVVIGVWLILILKDIRKLTQTLNQTVGNVENFTAKLNEPADFLGGMVKGLERGVEAIGLIKNFFGRGGEKGGGKE